MIWRVARIGRNGETLFQGNGVGMSDRFEFLNWIRSCCRAAGFADRARRQTDIPKIWETAESGSAFMVRNYSPIGPIDSLRFDCVSAELDLAEYVI